MGHAILAGFLVHVGQHLAVWTFRMFLRLPVVPVPFGPPPLKHPVTLVLEVPPIMNQLLLEKLARW